MKNGQLKPGYNVQIGTENQFIIGTVSIKNRRYYNIHSTFKDA